MPQSLAQLLVHVVFSTKNREPIIADDIRADLHAYVGGIIARHHGTLLSAGSVADHMHLLLAHPRTSTAADLIQDIKTGSSKWIKTRANRYRVFHWQARYGIFSVSASHRSALETYVAGQAERHRTISFQDEYRTLLREHGIEWNEHYVWD